MTAKHVTMDRTAHTTGITYTTIKHTDVELKVYMRKKKRKEYEV